MFCCFFPIYHCGHVDNIDFGSFGKTSPCEFWLLVAWKNGSFETEDSITGTMM